jgi:hypothetical protein
MHRTQILIESWHHETLVALAERTGRSISALVREILTEHFRRRQAMGRSKLCEMEGIAEGPPDLGRRHDDHLYGPSRES